MTLSEQDIEGFFQALGDRTRLRILNLLTAGELCVCYFVAILREPQPKISRHLAYLRRAGLVSARRDGKWIHYQLSRQADGSTGRILRALFEELDADADMRRDIAALQRACCATRLPAALADAPRPVIDRSAPEVPVLEEIEEEAERNDFSFID